MDEYLDKYNKIIIQLRIFLKKISTFNEYLQEKISDGKNVSLILKKLAAVESLVEKTTTKEIDFSELKANEAEYKVIECVTFLKDADVLFEKSLHDVEKTIKKRINIKKVYK